MSRGRERRYWDSDCFLGWLLEEADKVDHCRRVLEAADDGKVLIVTSALTIAEVLMLRHRPPLDASVKEKVKAFFKRDYIAVQNVTRRLSEAAREFVWDAGVKPKDAIHVATALDARLDVLNTFDGGLLNKSGRMGTPPLLIERPAMAQGTLDLSLARRSGRSGEPDGKEAGGPADARQQRGGPTH